MSLHINNISIKKITGETLLSNFNLIVKKGEILTLMGPSGCGKSTLLDIIAGHVTNDFNYSGTILLDKNRLDIQPPHRRKIGILFQDSLLFPHLTIWQNLAFALPNSIKGAKRKVEALEALENIELLNIAESYPEQISGGQRARIALMRMLLAKPKVALLDEPYSKLDKHLRAHFRNWVESQLQQANIPTLMVTHDSEDVPKGGICINWPWGTKNV
ncbi:ATP-binding cassette domain-containing protein [Vibrio sagamiensis]|uniref:ABC transporter ATP-binding protein n=1 Tax=Vibrio sagamiensis NBRC 104589 TaxID=1219064 RepID=A0A511QAY2_9VIBR|nr:ATP-binding cassette domain-containing protein [Vibrio sagamiensis]PNQ54348.1 ABC transporter ATP-binding protein [Vibrio agarivorans]GEM74471.1 ABC transporter ATP-binding protein [Vibrio sagamiensis NBRC 104589]